MRITYDAEVDALYILLREVKPDDSMDVEDGVTVDLDAHGHVVGMEILDAGERLGQESLSRLLYEQLGVASRRKEQGSTEQSHRKNPVPT